MKFLLTQAQEDTTAAVDTLTKAYGENWQGAEGVEQSSAFIQAAASNDLIFIVLAVSLIIWLVLLFFIIRVDRKVHDLEQQIERQSETSRTS